MPLLLGRVCLRAWCLITPPCPRSSTTSAILFIAFLLPAVFYFIGLRVTAVFSLNHYTNYLAGSLISFFFPLFPYSADPAEPNSGVKGLRLQTVVKLLWQINIFG